MDYFTSDTHFGQERTRLYSNRPFDDVAEMDTNLIINWNQTINHNDTVFHLGDFGNLMSVMRDNTFRLNGDIYLVCGNYEEKPEYQEELKLLKQHVTILPPNYYLPEYDLHLIHEPDEAIVYPEQDQFFLFGHIHEKQLIKRNGLNVGVDCHNYRPINIETINMYRSGIKDIFDHNCFMEYCGKVETQCKI